MNNIAPIINQLNHSGINLHAVFDLASLPEWIHNELETLYSDLSDYRQLILFAHGGKELWPHIRSMLDTSENPVDEYCIDLVTRLFNENPHVGEFKIIYPHQQPVGLQSLGKLAGWHHESPFKVGINQEWGSWFAYRAAALTDSEFQTTRKHDSASPCSSCSEKPCITSCPANALEREFSLPKCVSYRKQANSLCRDRCLARMACPVARTHQYTLEQINYHYGISMRIIEKL